MASSSDRQVRRGDTEAWWRRRIAHQLDAAARVPEAAVPAAVHALELELAVLVVRARGDVGEA